MGTPVTGRKKGFCEVCYCAASTGLLWEEQDVLEAQQGKESKFSNVEDRATATNLKSFRAILKAVFNPSKQLFRRQKSQQKDEYHLLEYPHLQCDKESGFPCRASGSPCLPEQHPVGCSSL